MLGTDPMGLTERKERKESDGTMMQLLLGNFSLPIMVLLPRRVATAST